MKLYIKSSSYTDTWRSLSGSDQSAVEYAVRYHDNGDDWWSAIRRAVNAINEGNSEPEYEDEDEDFYGDEANIDNVVRYIEERYGVEV